MDSQILPRPDRDATSRWLKSYYFARAAVAIVWFAAAFTVGKTSPSIAAVLLVAYPAWDALGNFIDAQRSGGLTLNRSQAINVAISTLAAIAVAAALTQGLHAVMAVFGAWAIIAGLLQLATGVRRWKNRCAMGDDPRRCAIGARRRLFHQTGNGGHNHRHQRYCAVCGVRRLIFLRFCRVAHRRANASSCGGPRCVTLWRKAASRRLCEK